IGIELDVIIPARQALTAGREVTSRSRIEEAALVSLSEAGRPPLERCPAATLETVPPQVLRIARPAVRVPETDHVDSVRPVRRAQGGLLGKLRELTGRAAGHPEVVHQIVTQRSARVGEPARILRVRGIKENPRGLERLRAQDDHASIDFFGLASDAIDIEQAPGAG